MRKDQFERIDAKICMVGVGEYTNELRQALRELWESSQWRPIETAEKSEIKCIELADDITVTVGVWSYHRNTWNDLLAGTTFSGALYWRPFPEPPKGGKVSEKNAELDLDAIEARAKRDLDTLNYNDTQCADDCLTLLAALRVERAERERLSIEVAMQKQEIERLIYELRERIKAVPTR